MSNEVTKFDNATLPAALAGFFGSDASDLTQNVGGGFTFMSIRGKVWTIVRGKDDRRVILNDEGDPRSSIEAVIVKANPNLSKVFYAKKFVEGSDAKPDCFSNDGITPDQSVEAPVAKKCATCPKNQWGSRVTDDGKKAKACGDSRRIAIAPVDDLRDVMLVRVPAASLGNLKEYGDKLLRRRIPYQAVITKLRFDPEAASPKLMFDYVDFINAAQAEIVKEVMDSDVVQQIVGTTLANEFEDNGDLGSAPANTQPAATAPTPAPAKGKARPVALVTENDIPDLPEKKPAAAPAPAPAGKKAPPKVANGESIAAVLDDVLDNVDD